MRIKRTSNQQKLECLSKTFLTNNEISIICDCGIHTAETIRKQYKKWAVLHQIEDIEKVYTEDFIEFANINVERIRKFAQEGM